MQKQYKHSVVQFDRFYEKARNVLKRGAANSTLLEANVNDASDIESMLTDFAIKVEGALSDPNLSSTGKSKAILAAQQEATSKVAGNNKLNTFDEGITNLQNQLDSAAAKFLKENTSSDPMLSYMQESETRNYLIRLRDDKKAEHEEWLAKESKAGRPVSDQMRTFRDPSEQIFLEACQTPSPEKAQLIRAVTGAHYPIEPLSRELVEEGLSVLKQSLSPDAAKLLKDSILRTEAYGVLLDGAASLIEKPEAIATRKNNTAFQRKG